MTTHSSAPTPLRGKVVVITGAAGGQGLAESRAAAAAGAKVIACDRHWTETSQEAGIERFTLDVTDPLQWQSLAAQLRTRNRPVHGLVNNAGIPFRARLGEVRLEDWNRVMAINVTGAMLGIQALTPLMTEGGSIVNVGSLAAVTAHPAAAYTASKWAIRGLSRVAAMQLGERNIRSNLINPGFIETPMTDAAPDSFRDANVRNTPLGRVGTVSDVAPLVVFLLSDASTFITGAEIAVDGGQSGHAGAKAIFDLDREAAAGASRRQFSAEGAV